MKLVDCMKKLREELSQKIEQGKQALIDRNEFDLALEFFEQAAHLAQEFSPPLHSIVGVAYAYMALALGKKNLRKEALDKITSAIEYLQSDLKNPLNFASILLGLGLEFQKIELFDCSIVVLKKALRLARSQEAESDLGAISIITRNLAFSLYKTENCEAAARLFRIAGDLEDQPDVAVDLYRNSAYLYYKENKKEEALNILETAFEKAGILGDIINQDKIARFQATISYEIFKKNQDNNLLQQAVAYAELCFEKLDFLKDEDWKIRILYEKAMVHGRLEETWLQIKLIQQVSESKYTQQSEEYLIKAILLLTIHFIEQDNFSEAIFHLQKISKEQMNRINTLNPPLAKKINETQLILKKYQERGQIKTDLRFSREELEKPVEQLLGKGELTIAENHLEQDDLSSLKPPTLEVSVPESDSSFSGLKPPSVEALHELFDEPEEISLPLPITVRTRKTDIVQPSQESLQERIPEYSRLFQAHKSWQEESLEESSFDSAPVEEPLDFETIREEAEEIVQFSDIRSEVGHRLQKAGWKVHYNFAGKIRKGAEPDILAEKGLIRKNRKLIFFAENTADAEICSFLLQSNLESGEKIVFLLQGNINDVDIPIEIKLVNQIDQLF